MVLILDLNSDNMNDGKCVFSEEKIGLVTALDLIKCLNRLLLTCAPFSDLLSNITNYCDKDILYLVKN